MYIEARNGIVLTSRSMDIPIGYVVPKFPSLYLPKGASKFKYNKSYLYYTKDSWRFTVYWSIIVIVGLYFAAAMLATLTHLYNGSKGGRHNSKRSVLFIIAVYVMMAVLQGFVAGSFVGLLLSAIYDSAQLRMSTWVPFAYSLVIGVYNVTSSYSLTSILM